jgi:hypothetical protein
MLFALTRTPTPESTTRRQAWSRTWAACVLLLVSACGSNAPLKDTGPGGSAAGSAGGSAGAAAGSAGSGPCPSQPPVAATSCNIASLTCEYGTDPSPWCRTYATCQQDQWQIEAVSTTDCPSMRATTCPASFAAAIDGACSEKGSWCTWDPGTTCECTDCSPGPVGPRCTGSPTWHCAQTESGCPTAIPRSGTACSGEPVVCEYGCEFGARRCTAGIWTEEGGLCPQSTRAVKEDIHYLSPAEIDGLAAQTEAMRVASYRYRSTAFGAPGTHLGFIIDDSPNVPAVSPSHQTVDLYGFASMLLATSQVQARRIEALERAVARLRTVERDGTKSSRIRGTRRAASQGGFP